MTSTREGLAEQIFLRLVAASGVEEIKPADVGDYGAWLGRLAYKMADGFAAVTDEQAATHADQCTLKCDWQDRPHRADEHVPLSAVAPSEGDKP